MKQNINFFLYARKSTDEENRQVTSLDAQMWTLREFAKSEGLFIYEIIEESKTAKRPGRPLFDQMLSRIERGEANGLLCWDVDRLYRNPVDEGRSNAPSKLFLGRAWTPRHLKHQVRCCRRSGLSGCRRFPPRRVQRWNCGSSPRCDDRILRLSALR